MQNYFEREILSIKRELTYLKTAMQKSAGVIETISQTVDLNLSLALDDSGNTAYARASYEVNSINDMLMMITLNWYYEDISKAHDFPYITRHAYFENGYNPRPIIRVTVRGTQADVNTLKNGGSVRVGVSLTVRATNEFTLEAI